MAHSLPQKHVRLSCLFFVHLLKNLSALQISTDTNITGSASLTGHLIPELVIGIDAFEGVVQSSITLSLDASATVAVNGTAGITDSSDSSAVITAPGACVDVSTALSVSAAASADLFDIFSSGASVSLFDKSFDLFNVSNAFFPSSRRVD